MKLRSCLLAVALAVGVPAVAFQSTDAQADTQRPEFFVGIALTAKKDHTLSNGPRATVIKKGTTGKVTKVISSGGKVVMLDVKVGEQAYTNVPVQRVRDNYDYPKL